MPLLQKNDRNTLSDLGKSVTKDVDVTLYTQRKSPLVVPGVVPCATCEYAEQLVNELAEVMPKVHVNILDLVEHREQAALAHVDRVPTMLLGGDAGQRVRFVGFPGGYEAATFVKALLEAGGAPDGLPEETRTKLGAMNNPIDIKVFVTPT